MAYKKSLVSIHDMVAIPCNELFTEDTLAFSIVSWDGYIARLSHTLKKTDDFSGDYSWLAISS